MPEIVKKNPVNDPTQKSVKTHSKFTPNYSRYDTHRFGLNVPHFAMGGVTDDDISMRCSADVDTFTLKAPLMQPVKRNMDYFQLPLRALLPNNAEYIITNPMFGDDVVSKDTNAVIWPDDLGVLCNSDFMGMFGKVSLGNTGASTKYFWDLIQSYLDAYQYGKLMLSAGALPRYLGYAFDERFKILANWTDADGNTVADEWSFDQAFEIVFSTIDHILNKLNTRLEIRSYSLSLSDASGASVGSLSTTYDNAGYLYGSEFPRPAAVNARTIWDLVDLMEETNDFIVIVGNEYDDAIFTKLNSTAFTSGMSTGSLNQSFFSYYVNDILNLGYTVPLFGQVRTSFVACPDYTNILRILAYQCACAEFYTSDKVDNIYSTKVYLQNLTALAFLSGSSIDRYYELNGVAVQYDAVSGHVLHDIINGGFYPTVGTAGSVNTSHMCAFAYWHNLLALTRSLKYEDYFVGARKQPLAVGDVTVGVDTGTNTVDVIDVTKKIQVQRFLNQVNRIGRKFSDYVKGILGDRPMKDAHEPIFLGHVVDTFGAEETDNTGEGQLTLPNSTTSKLRNNSSRYGFDVHIGEPSVIIGITNYDIVRVYKSFTDRENMHVDRFDMFNPFMQFVGDQDITINEIRPYGTKQPFGYTMRYMEYKQKVDQCAGGFAAGNLPGYARIVKSDEIPFNINSDFIRSHVNEMDQFYVSLTGLTPASRYNFIVRVDNEISAKRPMAYAPSIL